MNHRPSCIPMSIFSDEFRAQQEDPPRTPCWAKALLSNQGEGRMELALRMMAPPVSHGILTLLRSESMDEVFQGLGLFWAVCLAGADGWDAEMIVEQNKLKISKGGDQVLVCPMSIKPFRPCGVQVDRYRRLGLQLEGLMPEHQFVAHFKSDIPDGFDSSVLVEPVTNWIQEIERGVWSGGYAIYEDQDVAFELCLLDESKSNEKHGLLFHIAPLRTERMLRYTIPKIVNTVVERKKSDLPLVLLMLTDEPWSWNSSMLLNVLYGRCTAKIVHPNSDVEHQFLLSDLSMFASDVAKDIASFWWIEPVNGEVPIAGVSHRNPWFSGGIPSFPGLEYVGTVDTDIRRSVRVTVKPSSRVLKWMDGVGGRRR